MASNTRSNADQSGAPMCEFVVCFKSLFTRSFLLCFKSLGPMFLQWGIIRSTIYLKDVFIWVKWVKPFADKPDCYWSAEPQRKSLPLF